MQYCILRVHWLVLSAVAKGFTGRTRRCGGEVKAGSARQYSGLCAALWGACERCVRGEGRERTEEALFY